MTNINNDYINIFEQTFGNYDIQLYLSFKKTTSEQLVWYKKPNSSLTLNDIDHLWVKFLKELTYSESLYFEKTKWLFLTKLSILLKNTPYSEAYLASIVSIENEISRLQEKAEKVQISVVIPFYNRIQYTIEALESVVNQTHQKLEILLIDDGSEESINLLQSVIRKDLRIKYYKQNNKGASAARNLGIDNANGEYIAFLDSDDLWTTDKVNKQLLIMLKYGYGFLHTSYELFGKNNERSIVNSSNLSGHTFPYIISRCTIAMSTVLLKREILILNHYRFNEDIHLGEDVILWITISKDYEIGAIKQPLVHIRHHGSNAAYDTSKYIVGLTNIIHFVTLNYELAITHKYIMLLHNRIIYLMAEKYEHHHCKFLAKHNCVPAIKKYAKKSKTICFIYYKLMKPLIKFKR